MRDGEWERGIGREDERKRGRKRGRERGQQQNQLSNDNKPINDGYIKSVCRQALGEGEKERLSERECEHARKRMRERENE